MAVHSGPASSLTLRGEVVWLRRGEPGDAATLRRWELDSETMRLKAGYALVPWSLAAVEHDSRERHSARQEQDRLSLVVEAHDGTAVGAIFTTNLDARCGVFAYGISIDHQHRRRGYATDAIRTLVRHYFDELRFQKCEATVYAFNDASLALHASLGFVEEGRRRRATFTRGRYEDLVLFGLLREEFDAAPAAGGRS